VGNSGDPDNRHIEVFDELAKLPDSFEVIAPLAYGDANNRKRVQESGESTFGHRFESIVEMMSFEDYVSYLRSVDIAVFNHRRQQAMGNTIALLGMGKRVFLRRGTAQWALFRSLGVEVSAVDDGIDAVPLSSEHSSANIQLIAEAFSKKRLAAGWDALLRSGAGNGK
jgi:hypothetical protein